MFFDGSFFFFKRNSVNSVISICLSDLKDQKLPVSAIKTQIDDNRPKILLAWWCHKFIQCKGLMCILNQQGVLMSGRSLYTLLYCVNLWSVDM